MSHQPPSAPLASSSRRAGAPPPASNSRPGGGTGTGLLAGRPTDPWGIGQGIADAAGTSGSVLGGIGRRLEAGGTLMVGLLVLGAGVAMLGWMFLDTAPGRGLKRAVGNTGRAVGTAVALAPK